MARTFILAVLVCVLAPVAAAQIAVRGEWVSLGDVAPVTGEAAQMLVAPAPPPGQTLSLDPKFIIEAAKRSGVSLALPLDQPILVTRVAGIAGQEPAPHAVKAAPAPPKPPAAKPVSAAAAAALLPGGPASAASTPSISASGASPPAASGPPFGQVLIIVHDMPRGVKLAASDLDWAPPPSGLQLHSSPNDLANAIGQETRRALRGGSVLSFTDLKAATVIHKGESVTMYFVSDGMRLTLEGQAQGDAASGEAVRVLNKASKRQIDAIATGEGEARVSK